MTLRMPEQESPSPGGASELASFGEELRREREIRGISLKEIADATKISKRFLEALESNDHRTLPAPVFTRGFVREYARYVGLNAEEMVNRYNFAASNDDRIEKPPQIERYASTLPRDISPKPQAKRGIPHARVNRNAIAVFVIVLALASVAWWAVQQRLGEHDTAADNTPVTVTPQKPAVAVPPTLTPTPAVDDTKLRLEVQATDNSWISLKADGKSVYNDEMPRGDRHDFEATTSFRFETIGNAAGVALRLNGLEVPALGKEGQVLHGLTFNRESLDRLRSPEPKEQP
jgi:cytoskeletal protein RodZ